jgi:hypothetical protein
MHIGMCMQNRGDETMLIRKRCENNSLASGIRWAVQLFSSKRSSPVLLKICIVNFKIQKKKKKFNTKFSL